ncbi:hypothetical protein GIB67_021053 [Kingdonia uniflora]|uniref:Protein phosphatase n=1 Tax=Kingdonia uniflora TaxID=39325 RepID=A0A7J7N7A3_9MAGN|nr:hypothetical protein GIB67_021053 [Kingdonia uniflora]
MYLFMALHMRKRLEVLQIRHLNGLFDNLFSNEITAIVVHAIKAGLEPQVVAQSIVSIARKRVEDTHHDTPFSTAAQNACFEYHGGKLDDITVVASYISSSCSK